MAIISGNNASASAFTDAFKTGFAVVQQGKKEKKEKALSNAYADIIGSIGGEAEYDQNPTGPNGQVATAIPDPTAAPQQVQDIRAVNDGPTQQQQQLAEQANFGGSDFDVPQKISLVDHIDKRATARKSLKEAGVSAKDMMKFDEDYTAQMDKSARKYRDAALSAWQTGNFDRAAQLIESSYQFIADGSDVKAQFTPSGKPKLDANGQPMLDVNGQPIEDMVLAMGFRDELTGESSQKAPMITSMKDFAVMSEGALDYSKGVVLAKDLQAMEMLENANARANNKDGRDEKTSKNATAANDRAEGKYAFWNTNKDQDRDLDNLFKLLDGENAMKTAQSQLMARTAAYNKTFPSTATAKAALTYEKELSAEVNRRVTDDVKLQDPEYRQDYMAIAAATGRLTNGEMSYSEILSATSHATDTISSVNKLVEEKLKEERFSTLTEGARATKANEIKYDLMVSSGFLRNNEKEGIVEMRANAIDDSWVPAPPRVYGGDPIVTQHQLKSKYVSDLYGQYNSPQQSATINKIRDILGVSDYLGKGTAGAEVKTETTTTTPAEAAPVIEAKPTPVPKAPAEKPKVAPALPPIETTAVKPKTAKATATFSKPRGGKTATQKLKAYKKPLPKAKGKGKGRQAQRAEQKKVTNMVNTAATKVKSALSGGDLSNVTEEDVSSALHSATTFFSTRETQALVKHLEGSPKAVSSDSAPRQAIPTGDRFKNPSAFVPKDPTIKQVSR